MKITSVSQPSSTPTIISATGEAPHQGGGKRKSSKEKFVSLSKRSKRKIPEGPLIIVLFDPNVRITDRLQYHLDLEEKKPFKGMTIAEALE